MSYVKSAGTVFALGATPGIAKTMSAITNAPSAVATLEAAHGVAVGDYVEIASGWDVEDGRVARATAVATNDVTLGGIDTSLTSLHPAGQGTGSVREISAWTGLTNITPDWSIGGGEQNWADVTTVANLIRRRIPTDRNPIEITLPFFFDLSLAWVAAVRDAQNAASPRALRMTFPNGNIIVLNAYWSLMEMPTTQDGTLRGRIDLGVVGNPTAYVS